MNSRDRKEQPKRPVLKPPSKFETNATLVLWILVSVGLWLITPERFTKAEGTGPLMVMIVVGIIGLIIAVPLFGFLRRLFKGE